LRVATAAFCDHAIAAIIASSFERGRPTGRSMSYDLCIQASGIFVEWKDAASKIFHKDSLDLSRQIRPALAGGQ
jgi:hypothetical protein